MERLNTEYVEAIADSDIERVRSFPYTAQERSLAKEVLEHRAMVKRLEEWAQHLEHEPHVPPFMSAPFAKELRNRMKGDAK